MQIISPFVSVICVIGIAKSGGESHNAAPMSSTNFIEYADWTGLDGIARKIDYPQLQAHGLIPRSRLVIRDFILLNSPLFTAGGFFYGTC